MTRPTDRTITGDYLCYPGHYGVDYGCYNDPVWSPFDGTVTFAGKHSNPYDGNVVIIKSTDGVYESWLLHLSSWDVSAGQQVKEGEVVATSGNTGTNLLDPSLPYPYHLHWGLKKNGKWVNPEEYILNKTEMYTKEQYEVLLSDRNYWYETGTKALDELKTVQLDRNFWKNDDDAKTAELQAAYRSIDSLQKQLKDLQSMKPTAVNNSKIAALADEILSLVK